MPYSYRTSFYQLPYLGDGDILQESEERDFANVIENQIRAGILGAGGTRVYKEGTYFVEVSNINRTTVTLSGNPSVSGIANEGLVLTTDPISWVDLDPGNSYFLYLKATQDTYRDPSNVIPIASQTEILTDDHPPL